MNITQQFRRQYRLQYLLFVVLFLAIVIALAWLSVEYNIRSDWTASKRNSLTNDSIALLKTIDGPITVRSYQGDDSSLHQAVTEIFSRYQRHKKDIHFELLNPDLDIEQAKRDGISNYGQTVIRYNEQQEIIAVVSEQNIGNALLRLNRKNKPVLFFLQGHGERSPTDSSAIGYSNLARQLQTKGFVLRGLNLLRDSIEPNDGTLIIAGSSDKILAGEMEQIEHFLHQGGNMLWLQDPGMAEKFQPISELLNIEFINGVVVDTDPQLRKVLRLSHPAKLAIISYKMHAITEKMQNFTLFITAAAMRSKATSKWQVSHLLLTQASSWAETQGFILQVEYDQLSGDTRGPLTIGMALARTLPDQNNRQQRVVVIGDSDYLANNNLGHGANLDFSLNIINWLSNDEQLIAINTKAAPDFKLQLSDTQIAIIGFGFLLVLPAILISVGIFIWLKRRNQ
jgi:ABC-type uncharacterized transport system involved in gliding motility auxiliary subunit